MGNAGFVARAPQNVIEKYKKQIAEFEDKLVQLNASKNKLK